MHFRNMGTSESPARNIGEQASATLTKDRAGVAENSQDCEAIITDVIKVLSGDLIVTKEFGSSSETNIYLSYVTAPRLAKRPTKDVEGTTDQPFAWEAREYLRKRLLGKTIVFFKDFVDNSSRAHGRVYIFNKEDPENAEDITESAVAAGWLEVRENKSRSDLDYINGLLELQEAAKAGNKGKWGDASKAIRQIIWNIEDPRVLVNRYKKKPIKAVVEMVRSGSSLRALLLPNFEYITIFVSGVRTPLTFRDKKSEPFAEEAKTFLEERLLHHDVQIILESVHNDSFVGTIISSEGNIAEMLLDAGFAQCNDASIGYSAIGAEKLQAAEKRAKDMRLNLWQNYKEPQPIEKQDFVEKEAKIRKALVTEAIKGSLKFFAQMYDDGARIVKFTSDLRKYLSNANIEHDAYKAKRGEVCAVQSSIDGEWYRGRVEAVRAGKADMLFIDYGNRETVDSDKCVKLPSAFSNQAPFAREFSLAFTAIPNDKHYAKQCLTSFNNLLFSAPFVDIKFEYRLGSADYVQVIVEQNNEEKRDIGKTLIDGGFALVEKRKETRLQDVLNEYLSAEQKARKERLNIWEFGDCTADE